MKGRFITAKVIAEFKEHLILEERSEITVEKYIRDVKAFAAYAENNEITKETVIAYKKHLQEAYAVRSVNSMLASINSLFAFLGWHDLKVKSLKLQQQVFCPEDKELTKAEYARLCKTAERKHNKSLPQRGQVKKEYSKASLLRIVEKDKKKRLYCHSQFSVNSQSKFHS